MVPKYLRSSHSNSWKKIKFHVEMLPGPTLVVVTWPWALSCNHNCIKGDTLETTDAKLPLHLSLASRGIREGPPEYSGEMLGSSIQGWVRKWLFFKKLTKIISTKKYREKWNHSCHMKKNGVFSGVIRVFRVFRRIIQWSLIRVFRVFWRSIH